MAANSHPPSHHHHDDDHDEIFHDSEDTSDSNEEFASASEGDDDMPWEPVIQSPVIARQSPLLHTIQDQEQVETPRPAPATIASGLDQPAQQRLQSHDDNNTSRQPQYQQQLESPQHHHYEDHQQYEHQQHQHQLHQHYQPHMQTQLAPIYDQSYATSSSTTTTRNSFSFSDSHQQTYSYSQSRPPLHQHSSSSSATSSTLTHSQFSGSNQNLGRGATPKLRERMRQSPVLHSKVVQAYMDPHASSSSQRQQMTPEHVRQAWLQDHQDDAQQESSEDDFEDEEEEGSPDQRVPSHDAPSQDFRQSVEPSSATEFSQPDQQEVEASWGFDDQIDVAETHQADQMENSWGFENRVETQETQQSDEGEASRGFDERGLVEDILPPDQIETSWGFDDQLEIEEHATNPSFNAEQDVIASHTQQDDYPHIHDVHEDVEDGWGYDDQVIDLVETAGLNVPSTPVSAADDVSRVSIGGDYDNDAELDEPMDDTVNPFASPEDDLVAGQDFPVNPTSAAIDQDHLEEDVVNESVNHESLSYNHSEHEAYLNTSVELHSDFNQDENLQDAEASTYAAPLSQFQHNIEGRPSVEVHSNDFETHHPGTDVEATEAEASWGFDMDEFIDAEVRPMEQDLIHADYDHYEHESASEHQHPGSNITEESASYKEDHEHEQGSFTEDAPASIDQEVADADVEAGQYSHESDNEHDSEVREVLRAAHSNPFIGSEDGHETGASSSAPDEQDHESISGTTRSIDHAGGPTTDVTSQLDQKPDALPQFIDADALDVPRGPLTPAIVTEDLKSDSEGSDIYGDLSTARAAMSGSFNRLNEVLDDDDYLEHMERGVPMDRSINTPYSDDESPKFVMDDEVVELMERGEPRLADGTPAIPAESLDDDEESDMSEVVEEPVDATAKSIDKEVVVAEAADIPDLEPQVSFHGEDSLAKKIAEVTAPLSIIALSHSADQQDENEVHITASESSQDEVLGAPEPVDRLAGKAVADVVSDDQDPSNPFSDAAAIHDQDTWPSSEQSIKSTTEDVSEQVEHIQEHVEASEPTGQDMASAKERVDALDIDATPEEDAWGGQDMDIVVEAVQDEPPSVTSYDHADPTYHIPTNLVGGHIDHPKPQMGVDFTDDVNENLEEDAWANQDADDVVGSVDPLIIEEQDTISRADHDYQEGLSGNLQSQAVRVEAEAEQNNPDISAEKISESTPIAEHGLQSAIDIAVDEDDAWDEQESNVFVESEHTHAIPTELVVLEEDSQHHNIPATAAAVDYYNPIAEVIGNSPVHQALEVGEQESKTEVDLDGAIDAALEEHACANQEEDLAYDSTPVPAAEASSGELFAALGDKHQDRQDHYDHVVAVAINESSRDAGLDIDKSIQDVIEEDAWEDQDLVIEAVEEVNQESGSADANAGRENHQSQSQASTASQEPMNPILDAGAIEPVDIAIEREDMWGDQDIEIASSDDVHREEELASPFDRHTEHELHHTSDTQDLAHDAAVEIPSRVSEEHLEKPTHLFNLDEALEEDAWTGQDADADADANVGHVPVHVPILVGDAESKVGQESYPEGLTAEFDLDTALEDDAWAVQEDNVDIKQVHSAVPGCEEVEVSKEEQQSHIDSPVDEPATKSLSSHSIGSVLPHHASQQAKDVVEDAWGWDDDEVEVEQVETGDTSTQRNEEEIVTASTEADREQTSFGTNEERYEVSAEAVQAVDDEATPHALVPTTPVAISSSVTPDRMSPLTSQTERLSSEAFSGEGDEDSSGQSPWQDVSPASASKRSEAGMSIGSEFESEYSSRSMDGYERVSPVEDHQGHVYEYGQGQRHLHDRDRSSSDSAASESKRGMEGAMWTDWRQDDDWHVDSHEAVSGDEQHGHHQQQQHSEDTHHKDSTTSATVATVAIGTEDLPDISGADSWDFDLEDNDDIQITSSFVDQTHVAARADFSRSSLKTPDMSEHPATFEQSGNISSTLQSSKRELSSYQSSAGGSIPPSPSHHSQIQRSASVSSPSSESPAVATAPTAASEVEDDSHLPLAIRQQRARLAARGKPLPPISKYKSTKETSAVAEHGSNTLSPRLAAAVTATSPVISFTSPARTPVSPVFSVATVASSSLASPPTSTDQKYLTPALQKQRERLEQKRAAAASTPLSAARRFTVSETSTPNFSQSLGKVTSPQLSQATLPSAFKHTLASPTLTSKKTVHLSEIVESSSSITSPSVLSSPREEYGRTSRRRGSSNTSHVSSVAAVSPGLIASSPLIEGGISGGFMRRSKDGNRPKTGLGVEGLETDVVKSSQSDAYRYISRVSTSSSRSGWDDVVDEVQEEEGMEKKDHIQSGLTGLKTASTSKEIPTPGFLSGSISSSFYQQTVPGLDDDRDNGKDSYGDSKSFSPSAPGLLDSTSGSSASAYLSSKKMDDYDPYGPMASTKKTRKGGKARSSMDEDDRSPFAEHSETLIGRSAPSQGVSLFSPTSSTSMSHRHDHQHQHHQHHPHHDNSGSNSLLGDISDILHEKKMSGPGGISNNNNTSNNNTDDGRRPDLTSTASSSSNLQKSSSWSFGSWVSSAVAAASDTIDKAYESLDPEYSRIKSRGGALPSADGSAMTDAGLDDPDSLSPYKKPGYLVGGSSLALGLASISTTGGPSQQQQSQNQNQNQSQSQSQSQQQQSLGFGASSEASSPSPRLTRKNVSGR
ncbi:hypothetical protein BGZ58_002763 [Dissophora ornata]|nr:hypothetical protein BGZ58_002763 [Dissophora ornata]